MIINIVMIVKKRIGGKDAVLLSDFYFGAEMDFSDFVNVKQV